MYMRMYWKRPTEPAMTALLLLCALGSTLHEQANSDDVEALAATAANAAKSNDIINGVDVLGLTALNIALCNEYHPTEAVKALLEAGADANARNKFGNTALHMIARKTCGDDNKEANKAAVKVAKLLLIYGGEVDAPSVGGTGWSRDGSTDVTPLHVAADAGNIRILDLLLAKGAKVNTADSGGNTALHHAARAGRAKTVLNLVKAGANIKLKDNAGTVAMDYATRGRDNFAVEIRKHLENAKEIRNLYLQFEKKDAEKRAEKEAKRKKEREAMKEQGKIKVKGEL